MTATSVVGLRWGAERLYDPDPATLAAFIGQDAVSLVVGLPLLAASVWLARRGALAGRLLWMGTLFYVAYSYAFYVLGCRFSLLFPAHVAVVSMSTYALLGLLVEVDPNAVKAAFGPRTPARPVGGFLVAMALLFVSLWGGGIASAIASGRAPGPVPHLVWSLDLVVALPAMFWGGVLLWRRRPWGFVLAGVLLPKATLIGFTLVVTTALAARRGVPGDPVQTVAFVILGTVGLALTARYLYAIERAACAPGESVHGRIRVGRDEP